MSLEQIEQIFIEIKPFTDYVYLHVKGEPLLHPQIEEVLNLAHEYQINVNITTTGTLLKTVGFKLLDKPALRQINFSLHSFNPNLAVFNRLNYFEQIFEFTETIQQNSATIISYRLWNLNSMFEPELQRQKNKRILEEIQKNYSLPPIEEKYLPGKGIKIRERLFLNFEQQFRWPSLEDVLINENGFCQGLRTHIAILANGTVVPCCLDGEGVISLGNIFTEPLANIINSERAEAIFNGFSNGVACEPLCKKCSFKSKFS